MIPLLLMPRHEPPGRPEERFGAAQEEGRERGLVRLLKCSLCVGGCRWKGGGAYVCVSVCANNELYIKYSNSTYKKIHPLTYRPLL